jgi:hypothetical protein
MPKKWIEDRTVSLSGVIVAEATIFTIILKHYLVIGFEAGTILLFSALIIGFILLTIIVLRINQIEIKVRRISDPLITLASLYVFVDLIGLILVIFRNVTS